MSKKAKVAVPIIMFLVIIAVIFFSREWPETHLANDFVGTYGSGEGPDSCYLSIVPQDKDAFYFIDQSDDIYLKGTYKKRSNDIYIFACDHAYAQKILKKQEVKYCAQSLTVIINDHKMTFKKNSDTPIMIGDGSQYK